MRIASASREPGTLSRPTALLVAGAMFMELLDGTALTTASPRVAAALGVSSAAMAVPISAYLITVAAFIPLGGWVVDRFGGRRTFALAVVVFTLSSALCAAAPSLAILVAARVAQGIGGALMVPVGRLVVLRDIRREEVIRAVALFTWPALAAPLLGPVIGGILATYASWRWIFLLNLPLGVLALCCVGTIPADTGQIRRLDVRGWWSSAVCLGSLTAAAAIVAIPGAGLAPAFGCAVVGVVTGALAVHRLRTAPEPLISLGSLRVRTFRVSHAGGSVFRVVCNAVAFLVPLLFVDDFGWTPAHAGAALVALFAGNLGIKPATTPLLRRFGFRAVIVVSVCGLALTVALMATLSPSTPLVLILLLLAASGVFRSTGFSAYNTVAFADIDPAHLTDANTLSSTIQQLAVGLGAASGALALRFALLLDPHESYREAFVFIALTLIVPIVEGALLPAGAGGNLTRAASPKPAPSRS
ncbi:MFS transporter [Actinospica durhamensis]|uniref:MFS transporter n=1 Tax=Actinospica durhamensis TaxID=1508375 RepID=A0A941EZH6_9ACTN|nr:MFS transporter [Actinospica durhamensis]MBR7837049.1 MFS transporter [Actinospica durhamensis]